MLRRTWEFFVLFNKEVFYNKIAFFWTLIIPIIFIVFNNLDWLLKYPDYSTFRHNISFYWCYMILITAINGVGVSILILRDNGFLKMFKFIARTKTPIIVGRICSQWLFTVVNIVIFTVVSSLLFRQPIFSLLSAIIVIAFIAPLPVFLSFLWIGSLPYRQESVSPIFTILVFILIYLTKFSLKEGDMFVLEWLNPAVFILYLSKLVWTFDHNWNGRLIYQLLLAIFVYVFIGVVSYRRINVISKVGRS
ncbi:hypothetical protein [Anoxybacillus ayderensis]|uniref:hypothetical protein n=1 Tax=Anoxybacillus ayderensis TaxID=265546 RepID=UPI000A26AA93|nr:hypothetical protein [Anoxybacillus ayderensis]MED0657794.1 hypothetical protein [Anoxybacillus ayderensis]OSX53317.1 hypothetical protein B7H16_12200 [Anoxybacillus ayderensis]